MAGEQASQQPLMSLDSKQLPYSAPTLCGPYRQLYVATLLLCLLCVAALLCLLCLLYVAALLFRPILHCPIICRPTHCTSPYAASYDTV